MIDGLKPYPAYKNSGVEWLGQVPTHWEVLPGRTVFCEINDRGHPDEQMLSVTIARGVQRQADLLADSSKKTPRTRTSLITNSFSRVIWFITRCELGRGRWAFRLTAYIVQRLRRVENLPRYIHFLLRTPLFASEAERSYGITSDWWSLRPEELEWHLLAASPLPEQTAIVGFLGTQTAKIDTAKAADRRAIELLEEFSTRLIADVVTGKVKVDVRGF